MTIAEYFFPSGSADRGVQERIWDKVDASTSPGLRWIASYQGCQNIGAQDNNVWQMGHNVKPGGVLDNPSYTGMRDGWESYYEPTTAGVGQHERHVGSIHTLDGQEIRPFTITAPANVSKANCVPVSTGQVGTHDYMHPCASAPAVRFNTGSAPLYEGSVYTKYVRVMSSAPNDNLVMVAKGSAGHLFQSANGTLFQAVDPGAAVTAWPQMYAGAGSGGGVSFAIAGSSANAGFGFAARGTGRIHFSNASGDHLSVDASGITTNAPAGGTAAPWKLGSAHDGYVEVEIGGVAVKLATVP